MTRVHISPLHLSYFLEISTLECLIKGQARLFISKKMSSVSTDFYVVKYFFHPARLFGLLHKRAGGVATLPVY